MLSNQNLLAVAYSAFSILAVSKLFKWLKIRSIKAKYFRDKTVMITGASGGLGKAIAEELYPLGAQLILCARNKEQLDLVKANLMKSGAGKEPEVLVLDVASDIDVIKPKFDAMLEKFKRIDVLVNNAGVSFRGESFSTSDKVFQRMMDINFFGIVRLTNLLVNAVVKENEQCQKKDRKICSIVNIGSVQSYLATPYRSAYCATKFALLAYSDSLRAELFAHKNIDVINCQPGYINTNVSVNALTSDGAKNNVNDEEHKNGYEPNYVAQVVINSILGREKEVFISIFLHRVATWLRFFTPNLYAFIMARRARKVFDQKFQD